MSNFRLADKLPGEQVLLDSIFEPYSTKEVGICAAYQIHDPHTTHESSIISPVELGSIMNAIEDDRLSKLSKPKLVFTTAKDGTSLKTFLSKTCEGSSIILIRSVSGRSVVGAFCSDRWAMKSHDPYFGRGISFVFRLRPLQIYKWCHDNSLSKFQRLTNESLEVGAGIGSGSAALKLDSNLAHCRSGPSPTFNSPSLLNDPSDCTDPNPISRCIIVGEMELFALQDL
ncbi:hypothetical protein Ciccas_003055 [Cichlidogyrus casuarinus]|uniref:TLDc domain-containing protein n=1 Tax=Cichlidogyrus casuarinus TaxID=1844966 RepID=A0ABD2QFI3_9PLAT